MMFLPSTINLVNIYRRLKLCMQLRKVGKREGEKGSVTDGEKASGRGKKGVSVVCRRAKRSLRKYRVRMM